VPTSNREQFWPLRPRRFRQPWQKAFLGSPNNVYDFLCHVCLLKQRLYWNIKDKSCGEAHRSAAALKLLLTTRVSSFSRFEFFALKEKDFDYRIVFST